MKFVEASKNKEIFVPDEYNYTKDIIENFDDFKQAIKASLYWGTIEVSYEIICYILDNPTESLIYINDIYDEYNKVLYVFVVKLLCHLAIEDNKIAELVLDIMKT